MTKVHIIAEAGSNYNGDVNSAKELIDIAKRAKADSIKFQIINTYGLYLPGTYEYGHYDVKEVLNFREKCNLKEEQWAEVFNYGKELPIPVSASVFDQVSTKILMKHNPEYIKIASCDLNNIKFLLEVAETGKKLIISTGMATLTEIDKSVNELFKHNYNDIVLMHCVSAYPAELKEMNLNFIDTLHSKFGLDTGFSDHTKTSIAASLAVTKGVKYIEKHFTMDTTLSGLDHKHAMDENSLTNYIKDIRDSESALKTEKNKVSDREIYTMQRARRSLYAARDIEEGQFITKDDILVVRPNGPISADHYFDILGKKTKIKITKYEALKFNQFLL